MLAAVLAPLGAPAVGAPVPALGVPVRAAAAAALRAVVAVAPGGPLLRRRQLRHAAAPLPLQLLGALLVARLGLGADGRGEERLEQRVYLRPRWTTPQAVELA